ncbi:MAG TPA: 50S ribosomal protein L24 [Nitrospiraceae bacterium]|nr:50S ribosomal protein L24 [Nitrospiraceae bacterium]
MSLALKKNDTVIVIAGKEKGRRGRVLSVYPDKESLLVEKLNIIKKHMKPRKHYEKGGIIEKEAPIHRSNVMLICPKCEKPTKIEQDFLRGNKKVRVCKKCREVIDR